MEEPAKTDLLTIEGLCARLMISETIAYRLLRTGKIKAFKVGALWRIPVSAVDAYIAEQCEMMLESQQIIPQQP